MSADEAPPSGGPVPVAGETRERLCEMPAGEAAGDPADREDDERTGEAQQASTVGQACRDACALAYTAACLRVTQVCEGATVVTLGGATVPCATAIYATCLSAVVLARVCAGRCPP